MDVFLLIIRILLLLGVLAGIIMYMISGAVAKAKKFQKEEMTNHYQTKFKVWAMLVIAISIGLLMIMSLFN